MPGSAGLSADEEGVTVDLDRRQFLAGAATVAGVAAIGVAGGATPAFARSGDVDVSRPAPPPRSPSSPADRA